MPETLQQWARADQPLGVIVRFVKHAQLEFNCEGLLTGYRHHRKVEVVPMRLALCDFLDGKMHLVFEPCPAAVDGAASPPVAG